MINKDRSDTSSSSYKVIDFKKSVGNFQNDVDIDYNSYSDILSKLIGYYYLLRKIETA